MGKTMASAALLSILIGLLLCSISLGSPKDHIPQSDLDQASWSRFRGPNGQGVAESTSAPVRWNDGSVAWKTILPGEGHASPVIWNNQVYVTYSVKDPLMGVVAALDMTTGNVLWETSYPLAKSKLNGLNNYASSTPAVDETGLYVFWPSDNELLLSALGHNGHKKWSKNYGAINARHGICLSPIVYGDLILFSQEQYEKNATLKSRWLAVDRKNGQICWELPRNNRSPSYVTPCLYTDPSGQDQLIFTSQAHGMTAVSPSTGQIIWELSDILRDRTIGSPVIADNCIMASCGSGGGGKGLVFVRAGSTTTKPRLLHSVTNKLIPYTPTMLVVKNRLYAFHDSGTLSCWDIETATPLWSESLRSKFYGSPIAIGDHIFCISTKGDVFVVKAGDTYQPLAVNPLGEKSHATPAAADNRLFLRTLTSLTCVAQK